jgi:hypothetical protein
MAIPEKVGRVPIAYILGGIALLILLGLLLLLAWHSQSPKPEKTGKAVSPISHEEHLAR